MRRIKVFVTDVDGTLTDGKIYMGSNGEICKAFNIKDGYGIHDLLKSVGIYPIVITGRRSEVVKKRCEELEITLFYQGVKNKADLLSDILKEHGWSYENVAYIGDDINDIPCMQLVQNGKGIVGCPADAVKKVVQMSEFISNKNGGDGAVREFIEWILEKEKYAF